MSKELKDLLLDNQFLIELRLRLVVREDHFAVLCSCIEQLSKELEGESCVDKDIAALFFVIPKVLDGARRQFLRRHSPAAERIEAMALTLDSLIFRCLGQPLTSIEQTG
jgi:hypothetical protein